MITTTDTTEQNKKLFAKLMANLATTFQWVNKTQHVDWTSVSVDGRIRWMCQVGDKFAYGRTPMDAAMELMLREFAGAKQY